MMPPPASKGLPNAWNPEEIAPTNSSNAQYAPFPTMNSAAHQYGSLTETPGTSSSSGTGSSPSKTPKRPRDKKEMRKPRASATKSQMPARESIWGTLEARSSPDDKEMPSTIAAELRSISIQSTNMSHLHIFDPTATPAQLPQFKKNVMLDTRQLYRTWNIMLRYFI